VLLVVAMALHGVPVWHGGNIRDHPVLKRHFRQLDDARALLPHTRPGDLVLAPKGLSQTLLVMSGRIATVSPRGFFTVALARFPAMHVPARRRLEHFAQVGFAGRPATRARVERLDRDLRQVGVDDVCITRTFHAARAALARLGWRPLVRTRRTACLRAPVA
jgi:hypothetical protein